MDDEAVRCVRINPDTKTAIGGRVSRTRRFNLITIKIAAEQASRGLQVREVMCHCYLPESCGAAAPDGGPQW